jgi:hypothetical protein
MGEEVAVLHLSNCVSPKNNRTYVVALSNAALPAAAWYFPTVVRFSLVERKTNNKKKIKYRCECPHLGTV